VKTTIAAIVVRFVRTIDALMAVALTMTVHVMKSAKMAAANRAETNRNVTVMTTADEMRSAREGAACLVQENLSQSVG
jgi:hypothetical protein